MPETKDPTVARLEPDLRKYVDTSNEPISVANKATTPAKLNPKKKEK